MKSCAQSNARPDPLLVPASTPITVALAHDTAAGVSPPRQANLIRQLGNPTLHPTQHDAIAQDASSAIEGTLLEIRGDELFVLFGDEDHARHVWKAASAALAISRASISLKEELSGAHPPIILNMGINSGVAAVGLKSVEASSGSRWRYGASGTVVNIAARVRELARDGNILISADSAARVPNDFDFEDMGEHALKNVKDRVRVYRLIGEREDALLG